MTGEQIVNRAFAATSPYRLIPCDGEIGFCKSTGRTEFYCRRCLRWVDVVGVTVEDGKSRHIETAHK